MDDKLPAKTAKFTSLKNLYVYGICYTVTLTANFFLLHCIQKLGEPE